MSHPYNLVLAFLEGALESLSGGVGYDVGVIASLTLGHLTGKPAEQFEDMRDMEFRTQAFRELFLRAWEHERDRRTLLRPAMPETDPSSENLLRAA